MKHIPQFKTLLLFVFMGVLASCSKKDNEAAPVSLSVKIQYGKEDGQLNLPLAGVTVTINNLANGQSYNMKTNDKGEALFASITPGGYSGSANLNIPANLYSTRTGIRVDRDVQFNASFTGSSFTSLNSSLSIELVSGRIGDLVIKQFYYAGSNTTKGASFRDQFVEIYNNSNDTIYLDSLYFGNTIANLTKVSAGGTTFDWSKSINMSVNSGDPTKDYLYFKYLFMVPGAGKDHPLAPGNSFVVAQTAINHAATYTDNAGNVTSIIDPSLSVDLSNADYETYCVDYKRAEASNPASFTPYRWDLDNPRVPNMTVQLIATGNDWVFDATGREDLVIFKVPSGKTAKFPAFYNPTLTPDKVSATTVMYQQVPVGYVIDAMEVVTPLPTDRIPKRLPVSLDAAGTFVAGGQYSSQSLVRKTEKVLPSGRIVLQDTNNSSNDFFTKTKADPSKSDASFK